MKARDIALRVADLVGGERALQHGDALEAHTNIAALWSAYLGMPVTARDVALLMVLLKVARTKTGTANPDDFIDAAGYAAIAGEIGCPDAA